MIDMGMLREFQVLHDGSGRDDALTKMLHAESLEVLGAEMLEQLLACRLLREHPVVEFEGAEPRVEIAFKVAFAVAVIENLLG